MEEDLDPMDRSVTLISLPQYTFVHGLTSYKFLILRHNFNMFIHPTKARSDILKIHPELDAIIHITNFARDMKKLPAALSNIRLKGRTKKEDKSNQLFVTLASFRSYIVSSLRNHNLNVLNYSAIIAFLENPSQPAIPCSHGSPNSMPASFPVPSSHFTPQTSDFDVSSSNNLSQNIRSFNSSSSPDFHCCRILLSKGLLLLILSRLSQLSHYKQMAMKSLGLVL
jgi:hypothetical protein